MKGSIYIIRNEFNEKVYIGSTFQELSKRMKKHRLSCRYDKSKNRKLYQAMNELGKDKFHISLLEEVEVEHRRSLEAYEQKYIDYYKSYTEGYNGQRQCLTKEQVAEYKADWNKKNPEKVKESRLRNKENIREQNKAYNEKNKEKIEARKKEYNETDKGMEVRKKCMRNQKEKLKLERTINCIRCLFKDTSSWEERNPDYAKQTKKAYYQRMKMKDPEDALLCLKYLFYEPLGKKGWYLKNIEKERERNRLYARAKRALKA